MEAEKLRLLFDAIPQVRAAVAEIDSIIAEIEADERYHYKPALVQVNAPLALIQVELGARIRLARRIRDILTRPVTAQPESTR